jgi:8-oxoguanine deaminase
MGEVTGQPIWIRDPLAIFCDEESRGGIVVADGRIVELVPAGARPTTAEAVVFDASEHVVLPGLINTHHHFYQTLTRACPAALDKPLFPWLEALLSGTTTASDHHYVFPAGLEDAIDIQVEACRDLGIRAVLTRGSMSLSKDDGGLPPRTVVQREDVILADSERLATRYHQEGAMMQIALAPCSPFSVTRELMGDTAALAAKHGLRLHTHLAETRDEENWCLERFGCRPVDYLEELGWMGDRVWLAHGIWFSESEIARLGQAGVGISHCPSSNMILASGTCPTLDLEAAGAPVGLGVDGSASNDGSDMIGEVRQAFLLQRLAHGAERVSHNDALRWATEGSARCLGRPDIGRIAPGLQADLALFKLDERGSTGADRVMVAGRWVVEDGRIPGLDLDALSAEHQAQAHALQFS